MKAVNLIPTEQRRAQATGKQNGSSYIVIGVLVTLLAMVGAYVFTSNNVKDRNSKAAAAKARPTSSRPRSRSAARSRTSRTSRRPGSPRS